MQLLIALSLAGLFILLFRKPLLKKAWPFYAVVAVLACVTAFVKLPFLPLWSRTYLLDLFRKGYLATALFAVVMVTGALKNGSRPMKALMPLRGQLSICGGIFLLGHAAACIGTLLNPSSTSNAVLGLEWANIALSLFSLAIMLPLWITSFPAVRRKMSPVSWKRLQRWAYLFYLLTYLHLMVIAVSHLIEGKSGALLSIVVYTLIFFLYATARIQKASHGKRAWLPMSAALVLGAAVVLSAAQCAGVSGRAGVLAAGESAVASDGFDTDGNILDSGDYAASEEQASLYTDGVWQGEAMGYNGPITASVTISSGIITEIKVLSQSDDEPYYSEAEAGVLPKILAEQSTWVDAVTGATTTSWGIMDAVQAALDAAAA